MKEILENITANPEVATKATQILIGEIKKHAESQVHQAIHETTIEVKTEGYKRHHERRHTLDTSNPKIKEGIETLDASGPIAIQKMTTSEVAKQIYFDLVATIPRQPVPPENTDAHDIFERILRGEFDKSPPGIGDHQPEKTAIALITAVYSPAATEGFDYSEEDPIARAENFAHFLAEKYGIILPERSRFVNTSSILWSLGNLLEEQAKLERD